MSNRPLIVELPGIFNAEECFFGLNMNLGSRFEYLPISYPGYETKFSQPRPRKRKASMDEQIRYAHNVIKDSCRPDRMNIILGWSKGALIAAKIAEDICLDIDALILVAPAPPRGIKPPMAKALWMFKSCLWSLLWGNYIRRSRADTLKYVLNGADLSNEDKRYIWENLYWEPRSVLLELLNPPEVDLQYTGCHKLVVYGRRDLLVPPKTAIDIAKKYNADKLSVNAPHYMLSSRDLADNLIVWLEHKKII